MLETRETISITNDSAKAIHILYFTDPICSSCWGIEPQLRKLKLEYGHCIELEYHMGGLLPSWENFKSGGITKPTDVAVHWDEVSEHYQMPIDGDVWLEDPLHSSFPPSMAFIAAQLQGKDKGVQYLRRIREMVFLEKKNITRWHYLQQAAIETGLDLSQFRQDLEVKGKAQQLFEKDLQLARDWGARGFPTLYFRNRHGRQEVLYGARPYGYFERRVLALHPEAVKKPVDRDPRKLFSHYPTITTKEFSVLTDQTLEASEQVLNRLLLEGLVEKWTAKNGVLWKWKTTPAS